MLFTEEEVYPPADQEVEEEAPVADILERNGVMDCATPFARTNCSLSSTLVRPLAICSFGKGDGDIMTYVIGEEGWSIKWNKWRTEENNEY